MGFVPKKTRQAWLEGSIAALSGLTIKAVICDSADYTPNENTDDFLSGIATIARVATSGALANKTVTDGVFNADDITVTSVTGDTSEIVAVYIDTGVEATSRILAIADGVTLTPNGNNVVIAWHASGIFAI